jgi:hypothetical protein
MLRVTDEINPTEHLSKALSMASMVKESIRAGGCLSMSDTAYSDVLTGFEGSDITSGETPDVICLREDQL